MLSVKNIGPQGKLRLAKVVCDTCGSLSLPIRNTEHFNAAFQYTYAGNTMVSKIGKCLMFIFDNCESDVYSAYDSI